MIAMRNKAITTARIAVAVLESIPSKSILPKIATNDAVNADSSAYIIQIYSIFVF